MIGLIVAFGTLFSNYASTKIKTNYEIMKVAKELEQLNEERSILLNTMQERIDRLDRRINDVIKIPNDTIIAVKLKEQEGNYVQLLKRLTNMEKAVLQDPAKALEMPLLRKDFDHLKKTYEIDSISLKNEVSRIYDLNKWFIGLMFSMAIGIISLAILNFIKSSKKEEG